MAQAGTDPTTLNNITELRPPPRDRTAAERQKRYRAKQRRKTSTALCCAVEISQARAFAVLSPRALAVHAIHPRNIRLAACAVIRSTATRGCAARAALFQFENFTPGAART